MSDTSTPVSSTGFTASQSQPTSLTSNDAPSTKPGGKARGFGGKFFDSIEVGPKASDIQQGSFSASEGNEGGGDSEGSGSDGQDSTLSEAATEATDDLLEATAEGEGREKPKAEKKPGDKPAKVYKAKVDGKNVDVPLDAQFTVPVDGKQTKVSIDELVRSYNGKVSWDKRFTALDKDRQTFSQERSAHEADKASLNQGLSQFFKLVQAKKGPQAWSHLIKMAGLEGQYSLADLRREVYEQQVQLEKMSPEQRKAQEAAEQAEYYKSEFENLTSAQKAQQAQAQAEQAFEQVLNSHSISRQQFGDYHSQLTQGGIHPDSITPDLVISYHQRIGAYKAIREAADKTDPSILKNEKLVSQLRDFKLANPDMEAKDIADVIRSWKGTKRAQVISDKVRTAKPISTQIRKADPVRRSSNGRVIREDYMF